MLPRGHQYPFAEVDLGDEMWNFAFALPISLNAFSARAATCDFWLIAFDESRWIGQDLDALVYAATRFTLQNITDADIGRLTSAHAAAVKSALREAIHTLVRNLWPDGLSVN